MSIIDTIEEFKGFISELESSCSQDRIDHIRKEASVCDDLMIYSYEIVDSSSPEWKLLESLITRVFDLISNLGLSCQS